MNYDSTNCDYKWQINGRKGILFFTYGEFQSMNEERGLSLTRWYLTNFQGTFFKVTSQYFLCVEVLKIKNRGSVPDWRRIRRHAT